MPDREDADHIRPRLYTRDDPKKPDDVGLLLDLIDPAIKQAMANKDVGRVDHLLALRRRITGYADGAYDSDPPPHDFSGGK